MKYLVEQYQNLIAMAEARLEASRSAAETNAILADLDQLDAELERWTNA
jgi:predicted  nucleic acid-binding Zn-ribbon protein